MLLPETIGEWFPIEVKSIEIPILKYFSNYHAWSYRMWLLQKILYDQGIPLEQKLLVLESEVNCTDAWMNTQVSDYCGHHYRHKLLHLLQLTVPENSSTTHHEKFIARMKKELDQNAKQIELYEGHESLWCHRRAVMKMLLEYLADNGSDECNNSHSVIIKDLVYNEQKFVSLIISDDNVAENSKERTTLNCNHCRKYVAWTNAQFSKFNWQLSTNDFNSSQSCI